MSTLIRLTYFGMDGEGKTVTEAKRDAGAKIERALSGDWSPTVLEWRGSAYLIFREPGGWCGRLIAYGDEGLRPGRVHASPNHATEKEAIAEAQGNLAQLGWTPEDGAEPPPFLTDRSLVGEFKHWVEAQTRHRAARAAGLDENTAHHYACRFLATPEMLAAVRAAGLPD